MGLILFGEYAHPTDKLAVDLSHGSLERERSLEFCKRH